MAKAIAKFKVPGVAKDREHIVKETKRDLGEMPNEPSARKSIDVIKEFNVSESAKTSEARKQFRELIQFITEYRPDYLIAYAIDRITRNPEDLGNIDYS